MTVKRRSPRVPTEKHRESSKLSALYRREAARQIAQAEAAAPVLSALRATLATCAESSVRAWLETHRESLTVNARTSATALRLIAMWWNRLDDPLFDEPDDFWIWARAQLTRRSAAPMALQLTFTGDSLADILRQVTRLAHAGLESVPATTPSTAADAVTEEQVREAMQHVLKLPNGRAWLADVFAEFGALSLSSLKPEYYAAFIGKAKALY